MANYNLNDRPMPGGSMATRLNAKIVNTELNAKLGPRMPSRSNDGEPGKGRRREVIGLPPRLENKG
jgi:hypothetical protein